MNLLENTADFVSSQLSSGSTDPGVLQDVGASLLHGISNVITIITYCVTKIIPIAGSPVIGQFFNTMIESSIDKEWLY